MSRVSTAPHSIALATLFGGVSILVPPFCHNAFAGGLGACCTPTGACVEVAAGACAGAFQGAGTTCDVDSSWDAAVQHCCPQPLGAFSGADNCEDATFHVLLVPNPGDDAVSVTIMGDNSAASSVPANPDSCDAMAPSADPTVDEGWWEAFIIDQCAYVRVDHCCTVPAMYPLNRFLFTDCPCQDGTEVLPASNPNLVIAPGQQDPEFCLGGPYCNDGNGWMWFGPLEPGDYFYPVLSPEAGAGFRGIYQLHFTVMPCPVAACCAPDGTCVELNELECAALLGRFLAPPYQMPAVTTCTPATCATGSCCTPAGACMDTIPAGGPPATPVACAGLGGTYYGGLDCKGQPCVPTPRPPALLPEPGAVAKNRYVSFTVPATPDDTAIRVEFQSLQRPTPPNLPIFPSPDWSDRERHVRFVGPPGLCSETQIPPASFNCASLQTTPVFRDWDGILGGAPLHVRGVELVPSSTYELTQVPSWCAGTEATCADRSDPLIVNTQRWGDVVAPFQAPAPPLTQPNILDIAAILDKFRGVLGAVIVARADIQPNLPTFVINIADIASGVDAFRALAYPFPGPAQCP